MQFINKLATYGQALSLKQIAILCGLVVATSTSGLVLADHFSTPVRHALSDQVGAIQTNFKAKKSGAAIYNIKIYTPPGTAYVQTAAAEHSVPRLCVVRPRLCSV